jgi:hypothetical protein
MAPRQGPWPYPTPRAPAAPESLRAYQKALELHRQRQAAVEEQRRAAQQRRQQRQAEGGGLFGEDDDEEEGAEAAEHHVPADLLNNTAVLLYRWPHAAVPSPAAGLCHGLGSRAGARSAAAAPLLRKLTWPELEQR